MTTSGHLKRVFKVVTACLHLLQLLPQLLHQRQHRLPHRLLPLLLHQLQSHLHLLLCLLRQPLKR